MDSIPPQLALKLSVVRLAFTSRACWDRYDIPMQLRMITSNFSLVRLFCKSTVIKSGFKLKYCLGLWNWRKLCLHGTASVWNRYEIGTDKPCVYTGPGGSGTDRICYLVPSVPTYEGDPIWNCIIPASNWSHINRVDPHHSGSDHKQIWTYPIPCKSSLNSFWYSYFS